MPNEFYNPYHFVPFDDAITQNHQGKDAPDAKACMDPGLSDDMDHSVYSGHSGIIRCTIETITPICVGGRQTRLGESKKDETGKTVDQDGATGPSVVEFFQWNGKPAIPGSTLKGMLSSLVEAATGSAMRVFDGSQIMSFRQEVKDALGAIGELQYSDKENNWSLKPLTAPAKEMYNIGSNKWRFPFNGYCNFHQYTNGILVRDGVGYSNVGEFCYRKGEADVWEGGKATDVTAAIASGEISPRIKIRKGQQFITAQDRNGTRKNIRGVIRASGKESPDLPKRHELFIPLGEKSENARILSITTDVIDFFYTLANERSDQPKTGNSPCLPYLPKHKRAADKKFKSIENEREEAPVVKGASRRVRLQTGHLVYFDVDDDGAPSRIQFSAIWRDAIRRPETKRPATLRDAVLSMGGGAGELLPMSAERKTITMAERMFGFVAEDHDESPGEKNGDTTGQGRTEMAINHPAFRGKIRISMAKVKSEGDVYICNEWDERAEPDLKHILPAVSLRAGIGDIRQYAVLCEMASPRMTPHLSLEKHGGKSAGLKRRNMKLAKREIGSDAPQREGTVRPMGRKMYLHDNGKVKQRWRSRRPGKSRINFESDEPNTKTKLWNGADRQMLAQLVKPETEFTFEIRFDNLTDKELQALCFALRPSKTFRHKLGLGKPLGLGSVKITTEALEFIDRRKRYESADWMIAGKEPVPDEASETAETRVDDLAQKHREWMGEVGFKRALKALDLLGDPNSNTDGPITYPITEQQFGRPQFGPAEEKLFQWFSKNDRQDHPKALEPICDDSSEVPRLKTNR